jgi:hypothetical protein
MRNTSINYLFNQIETNSTKLLSKKNKTTQKKYSTALKCAVKTYGRQDGFLKKICNIWVRFINCIKYFSGLSDWQIASAFLRAEQKSQHANSLNIMKHVVDTIKKSEILGGFKDSESRLLSAITEAHKHYVKIYTCDHKKISDIQLHILMKSSHIRSKSEKDFFNKYRKIVHAKFDKPVTHLAKQIASTVMNELPKSNFQHSAQVILYQQLCCKAKEALVSAYDPLSVC